MYNENVKTKCHAIIHSASLAAGGVGLSPIPGSDAPAIMAIQVGMVISLGVVFGMQISKSSAIGMVKSALAKKLGTMAVSQLSKFIPVLGSAINASVAAGFTEALGWETVNEFLNDRKLLDCSRN